MRTRRGQFPRFRRISARAIKERPKFVLCRLKARPSVGGELASGAIDIKIEHGHR